MFKQEKIKRILENIVNSKTKKWAKFTSIVDKKDKKHGEYFTFLSAFIASIFIRFFVVAVSSRFSYSSGGILIDFILQDFLIFLLSFLSIWIVLSYILRCKPKELKYIMILATPLVILPPLIDFVDTKGGGHWSFYINESLRGLYPIYITFFDNLPPAIEYFGTKIMVFVAVFMISLYVAYKFFVKSRSFLKTLISFFTTAIIMYSIFFFYASFPSWFSFFYYLVFEHKSIMSVTLADISALFITPYKIFHTNSFDISNALLKKLNMIYALLVIPLIIWKEKRDANIVFSRNILKKFRTNLFDKFLDVLIVLFTPIFFVLLGFYDNAPFEDLLFSFIYFICITLLFALFALFFISSSKYLRRILGIFIGIIAFVVGYKILFLFIVLALGLFALNFVNINFKITSLVFSSVITGFTFYLIFLPEQKLVVFPLYLFVYTLITILFVSILRKKTSAKHVFLKERVLDLIVGISIIVNILISNIYSSFAILLLLFFLLATNVFFVKKYNVYYIFINIFVSLILLFSIFSAVILINN